MLNIGLLGLGTVGTGVVKILEERKEDIEKTINKEINISKILVKNINKKRDIDVDRTKLTTDICEVIEDSNINVIIEVMGGLDEPYNYIKEALNREKHVITANKAVVSKHFEELTKLSKEKNKFFLYEGSVGGGIPIIKPLKEQMVTNDIQEIKGILNGTTNYILSKMLSENLSFEETLRLSQRLGYAETNPTDDIEGYDTRRKLRILSTIAFKDTINEEDIPCYGISSINLEDIENIKKMGCTIKLLGLSAASNNKYYASVEPVILKEDSYFGKVKDANNLVSFLGDVVGELRFFGKGAGSFPTANAIIGDLIDIGADTSPKNLVLKDNHLINGNQFVQGKYYMRIVAEDDVKYKVKKYIIDSKVSENIVEKENSIIFTTKLVPKKKLEKIIDEYMIDDKDYFIARLEL